MSLDRLWAGWRSSYVDNVANADSADGGCIFCSLQDRDDEVVAREPHAFAILNRYPYTSGHLLVAPTRHTGDLEALSADEAAALMRMTQHATAAVKAGYRPDGVNVGMNLGRAA
ncbi:MAG TPA: HIT domain-containing protein, partial [Acidimicrobiia bacterium]|nr:HIT domain-containing protein [Acidimicrobiia bacterium]